MRALVLADTAVNPVAERLRKVLRTKVEPEGTVSITFDQVERRLASGRPELLFVVLPFDPELGLDVLRRAGRFGAAYVIAVGPVNDAKLILRSLQEGAGYYVDESEIERDLEAVLTRWQTREEVANAAGQVIAVIGASGGSGTSTLAVNIAATYAQETGRCALFDLKPGRGDVATLLDRRPTHTLADICLNAARVDRSMFEKILCVHSSGIHLLASPQMYGSTRLITTQGVSEAVSMARRLFAHVVVDCEDCFHEEQLVALRQAAATVIVSRLDFTSLRNLRRILEHLADEGIARHTIHLAINRYGTPGELPAGEAEEALGGKLAYFIPDDPKLVNGANNTGIPVVLKNPTAKVSQAMAGMALGIVERRKKDAPDNRFKATVGRTLSLFSSFSRTS